MALRCKKSFSAYVNGAPRVVKTGQLVPDDDPIVKGRETSFESVDAHLAARRPRVEQATADPGQPRDLTPPAPPADPGPPPPAPDTPPATPEPNPAPGPAGDSKPPARRGRGRTAK
ncbi:hypothetical protein [Streptomyces sp. SID8352]|uniref:hypothetical protein n=1 Tax=Streptomyces sp. SID8352 TaxID=2690338 RepID=UPI00136E4F19|nr:hypothetical protein [Streptomyces sp. SID8352]MYU24757.1 hypothetical protein [Streptomyces sp. SID8352]